MNAFPINDWQFWVATVLVVVALWFVIRPLLPRQSKGPACPSCPSKTASPQSQSRHTELTMEGTKIHTP